MESPRVQLLFLHLSPFKFGVMVTVSCQLCGEINPSPVGSGGGGRRQLPGGGTGNNGGRGGL